MNRCLVNGLVVAVLALLLRPTAAQEEAAATKPPEPPRVPAELEERYQKMAEQLKQPPAKRDFKVVPVDAQKTPLLRADPKLFENKFVALLSLQPKGFDLTNKDSMSQHWHRLQRDGQKLNEYPNDLTQLLNIGDFKILHASFAQRRSGGGKVNVEDVGDRFKRLAELCPPDLAPEKRVVEYLTSPESNRDIVQRLSSFEYKLPEGNPALHQQLIYQVLAPTAEEAEQRARAIVQLYDGGLWRPMRQYLLEQGQERLKQAQPQYLELAKLTDEVRIETETLAKPSEISTEILSELKAQKVMVAVELAGLSARVKACDAMLADPKKLEISTLQSISDMKVKAEVERVGSKEKLDQINIFIAEGDSRKMAYQRQLSLYEKQRQVRADIHNSEYSAAIYADLYDLYAPFALVENQITVGPIEWVQQ